MKKISVFLLLVLNLFVFSAKIVLAEEADDLFAGARYVVDEVLEENLLPYGVIHQHVAGKTSTSMEGYDADGFGGKPDLVVPGQLYDQRVNVMEIPSDENVKITTWAYLSGHKWTLATVRTLINDYEAKHPGWKVVGAINGDFFDINAKGNLPYQTSGALVTAGEFYKTSTGNLVGFRNDGSTDSLVGNKKVERTSKMILSIYDDQDEVIKEFDIDKVNEDPSVNETAVYYAVYGDDKKIIPVNVNKDGYFVDKAELALPNRANDFYGKGTISSLKSKTISVGEFAIVSNDDEVNALLDLDVKIRVQYKFVGAYEGINDISGGGTTIIDNGEDSGTSLEDRAPRTIIGKKADGTIIMMVIDGRQSDNGMYGADRTELGAIMNYYGAVEAYNLDGGGSSTMVIKKDGKFEVMNSPSDGRERTDANAILVVVKDPEINSTTTSTVESINLDIDLVNKNNHDIEELYVTLNGETKLVDNGSVTFSNLDSNKEYFYYFEYKDSNNKMVRIVTTGLAKTYKLEPEFIGIEVFEDSSNFRIKLNYNDIDKASNLSQAEVYINGKFYGYFFDGLKNVSKSNIPEINEVKLTTFVNVGDGKNRKLEYVITDFELERTVDAYIQDIFNKHNEMLTHFFRQSN